MTTEVQNTQGRRGARPVRPSKVAPLSSPAKRLLVQTLLRNESALRAARPIVDPADFMDTSLALALLCKAVYQFHEKYEQLPTLRTLSVELSAMRAADPGSFDPETLAELQSLARTAYSEKFDSLTSVLSARYAGDLSRRFAQETAVRKLADSIQSHSSMPADLPAFLREYLTKVETASSAGIASGSAELFPDGWDDVPMMVRRPTGSPILDVLMAGGLAARWLGLFCAPFGSCKTTIAVQAMTVLAEQAYTLHQNAPGDKRPMVFLFTLEAGLDEIRQRALASAALIDKNYLVGTRPLDTLAEAEEGLSTYEEEVFADQIANGCYVHPADRARQAIDLLNRYVHVADLTAMDSGTSRFSRLAGAADIQAYMEDFLQQHTDVYPYFVWFDHLSAMASRVLAARNLGYEQEHHVLRTLPEEFKKHVAHKFDVPVMVLHQLSGKANGLAPGADLSMTDTRGSAAVVEFADYAVFAGNPELPDNVCKFRDVKRRHGAPALPRFGRILGQYNRVVDVTDLYDVAPGGRRIVSRLDIEAASGRPARPSGPDYSPRGH